MNINSGDDLEIVVDDNNIILKKYSKAKNNKDYIISIIDVYNSIYGFKTYVIVNNKEIRSEENICPFFQRAINERRIISNVNNNLLTNSISILYNNILYPIVFNGDLIAALIMFGNVNLDTMEKAAKVISRLIINKILE